MEAIYFGTFAPMHKGHYSDVILGLEHFERVNLVVSGYRGDRGEQAGLPLDLRVNLIEEIFSKNDRVNVCKLDETNIARYPNGWQEWLELIRKNIPHMEKCTFICGEKEYEQMLKNFGYNVILVDRTVIPISGTKIRNNPSKYSSYILGDFKKYLK